MKRYIYATLALLILAFAIGAGLSRPSGATAEITSSGLRYRLVATSPRVNRLVTGEVTSYVDGVPAEPVHSFVWDGVGSVPITGIAYYDIDPVNNTGKITARWFDKHGAWTFSQTAFAPPGHASGLRVGPGADDTQLIFGDPVPVDVYLHGDTTAGGAVLPTIFNVLATWGPAKVTLNGEPFDNPFDGPKPLWVAHTMTTAGARNEDGKVLTVNGDTFNPVEDPTNGFVDYDDREFHLVFHDAPQPLTNNFPPPLSFFYHLTFEDVKLVVEHAD